MELRVTPQFEHVAGTIEIVSLKAVTGVSAPQANATPRPGESSSARIHSTAADRRLDIDVTPA